MTQIGGIAGLASGPIPTLGLFGITVTPRPLYVQSSGYPASIVANCRLLGADAPVTYSLPINPDGRFAIAQGGRVQCTSFVGLVAGQTVTPRVRATDVRTGLYVERDMAFPCVAGRGVMINDDLIGDHVSTGYEGGFTISDGGDHNGGVCVTHDPANQFTFLTDYNRITGCGAGQPRGVFSMVVDATGYTGVPYSTSLIFTLDRLPLMTAIRFVPVICSTASQAGAIVGYLYAGNRENSFGWTMLDSGNGLFLVSPRADGVGVVTITRTPPLGVQSFTPQVTCGTSPFSAVQSLTVVQGTVLSPNAMSFTAAGVLDDWQQGQAVGTFAVAGILNPVWSVACDDNNHAWYQGQIFYTRFDGTSLAILTIAAATGVMSAPGQLSSRGHDVTVTGSDGINSCTRLFHIPVTAIVGPNLWVGPGMASAHPGFGFDKLESLAYIFSRRDFIAGNGFQGATIRVQPGDYIGDVSSTYDTRKGWFGPGKLLWADPVGRTRPRIYAAPFGAGGGGAIGAEGKAMLLFSDGDWTIQGFEVGCALGGISASNEANRYGTSAIRKEGNSYGDLTILDCVLTNNNNSIKPDGIAAHVTIQRCEIVNSGTAYVSTGATHGIYCAQPPLLLIEDCLFHETLSGHNIKSRAKKTIIRNTRSYDGPRGAASCLVDLPDGGDVLIENCDFHKGPNANSPAAIKFCAEYENGVRDGRPDRINKLVVRNSSIAVVTPTGNHWGTANAIELNPVVSGVDGSIASVEFTNNRVFLGSGTTLKSEWRAYGSPNDTTAPHVTETGTVLLALPDALNLTHPSLAPNPPARMTWYNWTTDNIDRPGDNYLNFCDVQMDFGNDDPRLAAGAAVGTVLGTLTAHGSDLYKLVSPTDPRVNPFGPGTVWSVTQDAQWDSAVPWAPAGTVNVTSNADGTGQWSTGRVLAAGVYYVKIRATGPTGVKADARTYLVAA